MDENSAKGIVTMTIIAAAISHDIMTAAPA
jgi:hypothetical protein